MGSTTNHWLKDVAAHAGLDLDLPLRPDISAIRKAWPVVARACGFSEDQFTQRVAGHFRIGVADVGTVDPQAVRLIPEAVARRYGILALSATNASLVVATSDPTNRSAQREIVALSSRQPVFLLGRPTRIAEAIERAYAPGRAPRNTLQTLVAQVAESDFKVVTNQGKGIFTSFDLEDPTVVQLADTLFRQAVRYRATEIHVEPGSTQGRVRYRIDGVLQHVINLPSTAYDRLVARMKHVAFERPGARPEDGFRVQVGDGPERRAYLITTPTPDGEVASVRLVDPNHVPTLATLDFDAQDARAIERILARKDGLVLITGPARSGTKGLVQAALASARGQNAISLSGRAEIPIPGVTSVRYDAFGGRSFAETLQELLERNPDVIHAGEVRDLATARIVLRTAVTGRKVLATVHTADAVSGVRRLVDIGLDPARLAESLHAVISLRRVRALCAACARPFDPERDGRSRERKLASVLGVTPVRLAVGCKTCAGTGYRGELPIAEVLEITPPMKAILAGAPSDAELLRAATAGGMRTFADAALARVARGESTVEEVERVLGFVPTREERADAIGPVLVVDDEPQDRLIVSGVLQRMGFRVVEAPDGETAMRLVEQGDEDFSLAVLDIYMPGLDGTEVLRRIRRSLATQALPVVVFTGSSDPRDELELLEAGADDFIVKPVRAERLAARVRAVLRRSGVRIAGGSPEG